MTTEHAKEAAGGRGGLPHAVHHGAAEREVVRRPGPLHIHELR